MGKVGKTMGWLEGKVRQWVDGRGRSDSGLVGGAGQTVGW